jgi:hypothetical protein
MSFVTIRHLITPVIRHYKTSDYPCHSSLYDIWLPLSFVTIPHLITPVIRHYKTSDYPSFVTIHLITPVIRHYATSDYPCHSSLCDIWLPLSFVTIRHLITPVIRYYATSYYTCHLSLIWLRLWYHQTSQYKSKKHNLVIYELKWDN